MTRRILERIPNYRAPTVDFAPLAITRREKYRFSSFHALENKRTYVTPVHLRRKVRDTFSRMYPTRVHQKTGTAHRAAKVRLISIEGVGD